MGIHLLKMLKQGLILATLLVLGQARPKMDSQWKHYKTKYMKNYVLGEEEMRRAIWEDNHEFIMRHNAAYEAGNETYSVGENEYTDLTTVEFASKLAGLEMVPPHSSNKIFQPLDAEVRSEVDWRTEGYVTPVKNQAACGSCWAFSTTGSMEGQWFKKTGDLVSLSEQQLVDCASDYGNYGCKGGIMEFAFQYIIDNGGLTTEEEYPYTAKDGRCHFDDSTVAATLSGFETIRRGSEADLQAAVSQVGPISVAIDAGHRGFQMYKHGVYHSILCSNTRLNHAVLAVGYGEEAGEKYWIVKNSWGKTWGDHGYIKMSRGRSNNCGIATQASYPVV